MITGISLRIVVVGAGITGLAAAYFLACGGHSVHVFESSKDLTELGAGIQIPPNAARVLYAYNLGDDIERSAVINSSIDLRRYSDGILLGKLRQNMKEEYGYPNMTIHRADLQQLLYHRAKRAGVKFTFGSRITYTDVQNPPGSSVKQIAEADLVVAADGISSALRHGLFPEPDDRLQLTDYTSTRIVLPRSKLEHDPDLRWLVEEPNNNMWVGPQRYVVAYSVRSGDLLNLVLLQPGEAPTGVYNEPCDITTVRDDFSAFDKTIRGILANTDSAHRWTISELPPLPSWIGLDGRLVLLGDAAHAMTPHAAQGAAQGFEDAAVLATCLSTINAKSEIKSALAVYESLRKARCTKVAELARANAMLFSMEDGPAQQTRDARLAPSTQNHANKHNPQDRESMNVKAPKKPRPLGDPQAGFKTPEFAEWINNHDVISEAKKEMENTDRSKMGTDSIHVYIWPFPMH